MTMDEIKAMTDDWITPATVAGALRMDTGRLIEYARQGQLPFPVVISGNRVKISRKGFLQTYGYTDPEENKPTSIEQHISKQLEIQNELLERILEEVQKWRRGL